MSTQRDRTAIRRARAASYCDDLLTWLGTFIEMEDLGESVSKTGLAEVKELMRRVHNLDAYPIPDPEHPDWHNQPGYLSGIESLKAHYRA